MKETLKSNSTAFLFTNNLKIARRNLVKHKLYTFINLTGLSISLAVCILITLFVKDELSFDRHFQEGEKIFRVARMNKDVNKQGSAITSYMLKPMLDGNLPGVEKITRVDFHSEMINLADGKQYLESDILFVDSTFFDIFSLSFIRGSRFTALNDPHGVVLDQETAQKYFGDLNPIGRSIEIRDKTFSVTGVIGNFPANSHFTGRIFIPLSGVTSWLPNWVLTNFSGSSLYTYIKTNANARQADLEAGINRLLASQELGYTPAPFFLQTLSSIHLKSDLKMEVQANGSEMTVYIFSATALVILVLACINYVNLSISGSWQRGKEVGMKKILGSSTRMQASQFQTESLLVTGASAVIAFILAKLSMPFFNHLSGKRLELDLFHDPTIGLGLMAMVFVIAFITGSFPAFLLLRINLMRLLSGNPGVRGGKSYFRNGLILFQFSTSIALIVSTLVVINQLHFIRQKDLGVKPEQLVIIPFQTTEIARRYDELKAVLAENPSVITISASDTKGTQDISTWREYVIDPAKGNVTIPTVTVSHNFFETMGASVLEGRTFSPNYPSDLTKAYVINESAAKLLNLDKPVGTFMFGTVYDGTEWSGKNAHIIGVVKDINFASLHRKASAVVFSLATERAEPLTWMEVRIASDNVQETIRSLEWAWIKIAPERPFQFEFMEDTIQQNYQAEDHFMNVFITFSSLSIFLGALGLFGLTAFITKQRTKEIGIRKVMGASIESMLHMLSINFLKLVLISNLIGWPVAYYLMNDWLQNFAYKTPISFWLFLATGVGTIIIAFLAIFYHSLKVSRANPVRALRYE